MSRLQRLKEHANDGDLAPKTVGEILGLSKAVIYDLIHQGKMECMTVRGKGMRRAAHRQSKSERPTHHFEPRQVLSFIIKNTQGDRQTLMAEIALLFPKWLSFAQLIAKQCDAAPTHKDIPLWGESEADLYTKPSPRAKHDPFAGSPEMFPLESLAKPTPANATPATL